MRPSLSPRTFLVHGLLAGLLAGLAGFLIAFAVGEPQVDAAIAVEESQSAPVQTHDDSATEHADEDVVVSRDTQRSWGLGTGTLVIGLVLGGVTALVAALAMGRLGRLDPTASTALVVGLGFVAVAVVPFLVYPPNPPAVGDPETIGSRTAAWFGLLWLSTMAMAAAVVIGRRLAAVRGVWAGVAVAAVGYLAVVVAAALLLPDGADPGSFPAGTLWDFRISSLLTLTAIWGVLGLALTGLVERTWRQVREVEARRALAASL